ncbi:UDP-rhamnose/UDP-galactose transporter 2 isoform X2 [Elaeis guineensis]
MFAGLFFNTLSLSLSLFLTFFKLSLGFLPPIPNPDPDPDERDPPTSLPQAFFQTLNSKPLLIFFGFFFLLFLATGFYFGVTAFMGFVSNVIRLSSSKHVPLWELLWFSIVANTSIAGMNLSLMLNFVGFYQISKLSMIPVVCVMEWILHSKHYSKEVKMAVVAVVVGVGVCTVTDVKVNAKGFLCACIAVLSTSLQQIVYFCSTGIDHLFRFDSLEGSISSLLRSQGYQFVNHLPIVGK